MIENATPVTSQLHNFEMFNNMSMLYDTYHFLKQRHWHRQSIQFQGWENLWKIHFTTFVMLVDGQLLLRVIGD
jgi:hypothetical protein